MLCVTDSYCGMSLPKYDWKYPIYHYYIETVLDVIPDLFSFSRAKGLHVSFDRLLSLPSGAYPNLRDMRVSFASVYIPSIAQPSFFSHFGALELYAN